MENEIIAIEKILLKNANRFCDYKTINGIEGSGIIRVNDDKAWVAYGYNDESTIDICELLEVCNITD
jgi:hypothetical protein